MIMVQGQIRKRASVEMPWTQTPHDSSTSCPGQGDEADKDDGGAPKPKGKPECGLPFHELTDRGDVGRHR